MQQLFVIIIVIIICGSPVCDVGLLRVLQSLLQLRRTHVRPHHWREVFGEQQRALSGATAHIHGQVKGTRLLSNVFGSISHKPAVPGNFTTLYVPASPGSPAPAESADLTGRSYISSRKQRAPCLQTCAGTWLHGGQSSQKARGWLHCQRRSRAQPSSGNWDDITSAFLSFVWSALI